jgi:septation ring formation regulator EzrA
VNEPAVVTLRDIFTKLQQVAEDVAALRQDARHADDVANDHESRLRSLERRIWALPSIATVIGGAGLALAWYDRLNHRG